MKSLKEIIGTAVATGATYVVLILVVILCVSFVLLEALLKRLTSSIMLLSEKTMTLADWTVRICSHFVTAATTSKLWKSVIAVEDCLADMGQKLKKKRF